MTRSASILVVAALLVAGCSGAQNLSDASPAALAVAGDQVLPVRRVVLFQNGVAYLERRGEFKGDELHLRVHPSHIGDILKSITVVDFKGGHANSLALPVDISSDRALAQLPKLALGQGALGALLGALRGAWVRLKTDSGESEGRLIGVDAGGEGGEQVSLLDRGGTIRLFDRSKVRSMRILDITLARGLEKGLDISLGREAWQSLELTIYLNRSSKARDLLVSYLVEMPTWKPSYRLVLDGAKDPLLQGWAIVDNVSGADWQDVKLTLTTGSPVSFHYDLYTPRFVERPDLTPYHTLGIPPPIAVSAHAPPPPPASVASRPRAPSKKKLSKSMAGRSRRDSARYEKERAYDYDGDMAGEELAAPEPEPSMDASTLYDSMNVQASTQKVGSLYRFDLGEPMTVPNRSSTMIALINSKIPGKAIYLYNPNTGVAAARKHPFRAVSIRNEAGSVLEPGPIAIIRDGTFVGEGLIQRIEKGHQSYISYALDTAVNVSYNSRSSSEVAGLVKISRGLIETKTYSIQRHIFEAQASAEDGEAIPLMVNVPKRSGWEITLDGGEKVSETAGAVYYSMPVKPGDKTKFEIKEKYPRHTSYRIADDAAQRAIMLYVKSDKADPRIASQLKPVVSKVRKLSDTRDEIRTLERKRSDLQQRASEIRENLRLLKRSRNQRLKDEQTNKLIKVDRKISRITDSLVSLRDKVAVLKVELANLVEQLEIEF